MKADLRKPALAAACALAGLGLAAYLIRKRRAFPWSNVRVVVTGGSRGLGLVLARELVEHGARVAICSRDANQLDTAAQSLQRAGGEIIAQPCDVRSPEQCRSLIDAVRRRWGGVDVLFNVAGIIEVGPFDAMTQEDFERSMDTHCWGALNMIRAVLPGMRENRWGRIVNVASLGGKRAVPHMLPYAASKFALVGLSIGLRTELADDGILVTTICPGLMRTGSPLNASFKGRHRREFAWFSIADALPLVSISAESAARKILGACQAGKSEAVITGALNFSSTLAALAPNLTAEILTLVNRLLPAMGGIGQASAKGYESRSCWSPSLLTELGDRAAARNNETPS